MSRTDTMTAEAEGSTTEESTTPSGRKRARLKKPPLKRTITPSSISFPYRDLDTGVTVAQAMLQAGGVALSTEQLAGVMNLAAGSGNFVVKTATARIFGLVSYVGGKYELTNLGFAIVDKNEARQRQARAEAFLTVPLYRRVYDEFRGKQLPPRPLGLEQAFVRFGVSTKQKVAARQVFDKAAVQAGYMTPNGDRLIEPIIAGGGAPPGNFGGGNGDGPGPSSPAQEPPQGPDVSGLNPFIQGLLETLPEPYTNWTIEGRAKWLQAAANIFDLIYKGTGEIDITAKGGDKQ